jgi:hypothetical protein
MSRVWIALMGSFCSAFCQNPLIGFKKLPSGGISPNLVWHKYNLVRVMAKDEMALKSFIGTICQ